MVETEIVVKDGRYEVRNVKSGKLYGSFRERERAEARARHVVDSSRPRREKRKKAGSAVAT